MHTRKTAMITTTILIVILSFLTLAFALQQQQQQQSYQSNTNRKFRSLTTETYGVRPSYGLSCNDTVRCDPRASLTCIENTCKCIKPQEMVFDRSRGKCVVLSGAKCSYSTVEVDADNPTRVENRWIETLECVDQATCNINGYCECSKLFRESTEGYCVPKGLNDDACLISTDCRLDKKLDCFNGRCQCNPNEAVFDPATQECLALSGKPCLYGKYTRCVTNAYCHRDYTGGTVSREYRCTCGSPFRTSTTGLCLRDYGQQCHPTLSPCVDAFSCENSICKCSFPEHQTYDYTTKECVGYVHAPCNSNGNKTFADTLNGTRNICMKNSECRVEHGIAQCLCKPGYIESLARACDIAYGQPCGGSSMESCDRIAGLQCVNKICQCTRLQVFDGKSSKCRGLVGSSCHLNNDTVSYCVDGATCVGYRDTSMSKGMCECMPGYVPSADRRCIEAGTESAFAPEEVVPSTEPLPMEPETETEAPEEPTTETVDASEE